MIVVGVQQLYSTDIELSKMSLLPSHEETQTASDDPRGIGGEDEAVDTA